MKHMLWLLKWVLKAAIFFTLFAFALNNQQDTTVYFFFGNHWRAPQVLVVLSAFSAGVAVGVLAMLPNWLRKRTQAQMPDGAQPQAPAMGSASTGAPSYADGI